MEYKRLMSSQLQEIKPSGIRKYFSLAEEMGDCLSLGVGEPDFVTPWEVRRAGIESLDQGKTFYSANAGLKELRRQISLYLKRAFGLGYDPDSETVVTVGGSEAIDMAMRALLNPGDEVLLPTPCFVCYEPIAKMCGARVIPLILKEENGFRLTAEELRAAITERTKLLVMPFPSNPTGAVMSRSDLESIAEVLKGTDIFVLSDEIYSELTYGGERHVSPASVSADMWDRTITVNGFSKSFAMTGWRLGYVCAPAPITEQIVKMHQFAIMCAPTTAQYAGIVALRDCEDVVASMRDEYDLRRRFIVDGFNRIGLHCFEPKGAFYVFPSVESTGLSDEEFCEQLIRRKRVAVIPGTAFGPGGEGHVRVSYSYSIKHIREALRRIGEFVREL
ncbi:MAG: aminotransferase class I/II-fold pyridoxal phosphate-dependent enzyme [Oscillospiraceae bacterium]|nr:aminotransferase class I/II-fold pyridoxal phosphate-dependent enzyme [Oscillospiraceae bacterium]MBQ4240287.1 aminotransferase class I/II-fold pyridoxal phosphate-dependent enzyme [Oscillospiraceae bacterium]